MSAELETSSISALVDDPSASPGLFSRLASIANEKNDTPEERMRKRLQISMAVASIPVVAGWGISFFLIGRPDAGVQPLAYCAATALMLAYLRSTRNFAFFSPAHTLLVLLGPYGTQLYLGGFAGSGGAMLWSVIAVLGSLMFADPGPSMRRVALLVVLVVINGAREVFFPGGAPLTPSQASAYFTFNTLGLAGFVFFATRYFTARIQREQERAEQLLLNILPGPIAQRLKKSPELIAERFSAVTVLFSDLVGFTQLSARLDPGHLVALLDEIFTRFDALADRFGLEKIKTIGDSYMVVAGLPAPCEDHAIRGARMALAMRDELVKFSEQRGYGLQMRLGLHTGEVVAGVIGKRKFSYDLWGDTVNVASRMESHGEPGRI